MVAEAAPYAEGREEEEAMLFPNFCVHNLLRAYLSHTWGQANFYRWEIEAQTGLALCPKDFGSTVP